MQLMVANDQLHRLFLLDEHSYSQSIHFRRVSSCALSDYESLENSFVDDDNNLHVSSGNEVGQ